VSEIQINRNEYFLAQATNKDKPNKRTQTIEIPDGYILCPVNYVCIPKDAYNGQSVVPSTVNQVPQATITNPNLNQLPSQSINQINQNLNPGIGQINNQQNGIPGGGYPNQGINPSFGQPGGIGINNQQNIGIGSGGIYNGGNNQPGKMNTSIEATFGIRTGVSW
jgi:hypothetical protein